MTESKQNQSTPAPIDQKGSLVDALFDVGLSWASYGLKVSRIALDKSAESLERTAKKLGELSSELGKKSDALKIEEKKAA
jgi:hypothetical protein